MVTAAPTGEAPLVTRLRALAELRHRDPNEVATTATAWLGDLSDDAPAVPTGRWVIGLAQHELGRPGDAVASYRAAAEGARRQDDAHTESLARASMAISLLSLGDAGAAQREIAA